MLLEDFIYSKYSIAFFALLIKDSSNERLVLSNDFFYDTNKKIRRDIHTKYYYKYFIFSDKLTDITFRYFDYDPDYNEYLYDANTYLQLTLRNYKDDSHIKKNKEILTYSKDDIFYYKYQKLYKNICKYLKM